MASIKDKDLTKTCLEEDNRAFVFNWLSTPFQKTDKGSTLNIDICLEDILDELQDDKDLPNMKIRIRP